MTAPGASHPQTADPSTVVGIVAEVVGLERVAGSDRLRGDLGIDSLTGTYIVARLLLRTGVRVGLPVVLEAETVDDLVARVAAVRPDRP